MTASGLQTRKAAKREQMSVANSGGGKDLRQDIKVELRIRP